MEATTTKTVTRAIYNRVPTGQFIGGYEQISTIKIGEKTINYTFTAHADSIEINGVKYRVEDCSEFAIKIHRTKIKANDGAKGLIKLFMRDTLDGWETKVIENCKPMK